MPEEKKELIYAILCDELYFMPRAKAIKAARIRRAVRKGSTWGELRTRVKPAEYQELLKFRHERFGQNDNNNPVRSVNGSYIIDESLELDERFPGRMFYELPDRCMSEWLPEDIVSQFAVSELSSGGEKKIYFSPDDEKPVIKRLGEMGFGCEKNLDLIAEVFDITFDEEIYIRVVENEEGRREMRTYNENGIEVIDTDPVDRIIEIQEGEEEIDAINRKLHEIHLEKKNLRKEREEIRHKNRKHEK